MYLRDYSIPACRQKVKCIMLFLGTGRFIFPSLGPWDHGWMPLSLWRRPLRRQSCTITFPAAQRITALWRQLLPGDHLTDNPAVVQGSLETCYQKPRDSPEGATCAAQETYRMKTVKLGYSFSAILSVICTKSKSFPRQLVCKDCLLQICERSIN